MRSRFRAIAVDYDGTITLSSRPSPQVLEALAEVRRAGIKVVLATGRIFSELLSIFPDAVSVFDAIVAENGAVLWLESTGKRALAEPVPRALEAALRAREIFVQRGDVILATDTRHDAAVLSEIARLGLDTQLMRNRGALMLLPAGVSKGKGIGEALGELGISPHNALAIGDAENDHALLESCEIGVAVGNAIPALKAHADLVLAKPDGVGISEFLSDLSNDTLASIVPTRWRVPIGTRVDGPVVTVPASGVNVLVAGGSGSGKSYMAGLFAERLLQLGYSLCVFDPEGDHAQLGNLRGTVTLGGKDGVPSPMQLGRILHRRFGGAVVDLSLLRSDERVDYTRKALARLEEQRAATGLPHWILLDEAHAALGETAGAAQCAQLAEKGYCLVTYHPTELHPAALGELDVLFFLPGSEDVARALFSRASVPSTSMSVEVVVEVIATLHRGQALMVDLRRSIADIVTLGRRRSSHVRHRHKYAQGFLPPRNHFYFRDETKPTGRYAANLEDFHRELQIASDAVISHHAKNGDFSRWIIEVLSDAALGAEVREIEREAVDPVLLRKRLVDVIGRRYGDDEQPASIA